MEAPRGMLGRIRVDDQVRVLIVIVFAPVVIVLKGMGRALVGWLVPARISDGLFHSIRVRP